MGSFERAVGIMLFMVSLNASLLIAGLTVPGYQQIAEKSDLFSLSPAGLQPSSVDASDLEVADSLSSDATSCTGAGCASNALLLGSNLFSNAIGFFQLAAQLLFGFVFAMQAMQFPTALIFLLGTPLSILNVYALFIILSNLVAIFTGGTVA